MDNAGEPEIKICRHPEYTIMRRFGGERGQWPFGEVDPDLLSLYGHYMPLGIVRSTRLRRPR